MKSGLGFECSSCGARAPKWAGRCDTCGEWNTMVEKAAAATPMQARISGGGFAGGVAGIALSRLNEEIEPPARWLTGIGELDRVLGGGLVPGSSVLISGDPGVGKSTLLLQGAAALAVRGHNVLYLSGEESKPQIQLRARRLQCHEAGIQVASSTDALAMCKLILESPPGTVAIVDSIQTVQMSSLDATMGSMSQIRRCGMELTQAAKANNVALILVGHVTKEGTLAGPKTLEHLVDAVLSVEGERSMNHRIVRTTKNRFGATDEIGVFEMTERGMTEVPNPSGLFLSDARAGTPGCAVFPTIEGTRPLLVEIQALLSPMAYGSPRRSVVGWDTARLAMILAVLETRCGVSLADSDVYLNVVGGLKITEPAADLAVAAALASAKLNIALPEHQVFFGEIGLAGEVRTVSLPEGRLREARKLGFESAVCPLLATLPTDFAVEPIQRLRVYVSRLARSAPTPPGQGEGRVEGRVRA